MEYLLDSTIMHGRESSKRTHISALCEYFFALNELGENHKQTLIVEFILENLQKEII